MRDVLLTLLVLFASAFVLSDCDEDAGCDSEPVQSVTLQPVATQTMIATIADEDTYSCWPFYCTCLCHLLVGCTLKADGDAGQVQAGDQRWRDEGTDPCPCAWYRNCVSRGRVLFDLSTLSGKDIVGAQLHWTSRGQHVRAIHEGVAPPAGVGLTPWGNVPSWPGGTVATFGSGTAGAGETEVGITVRGWVEQGVPNKGFVLTGPEDNLYVYANGIDRVSTAGGFSLVVLFTD